MPGQEKVELWFGDEQVGLVRNDFCSDDTWHGTFEPKPIGSDSVVLARVRSFVEFCQDWNDREMIGQANIDEFDTYRDIVEANSWHIKSIKEGFKTLDGAPVFFRNGEVSWRTIRNDPG